MKKIFKRVAAFLLSVMMVLTMSDWSDFASTLAKAEETVRIYFYNGDGWDQVHMHAWENVNGSDVQVTEGAWPGTDFIGNVENGWSYIDLKGSFTGAILTNNGDGTARYEFSNTGNSQYIIYKDGAFEAYQTKADADARVAELNKPAAGTFRVHFYDGDGWNGANAYGWKDSQDYGLGGWPGTGLSNDGDNWYHIDINADSDGFKINKASDFNNESYQYQLEGDAIDGNDKWIVCKRNTFRVFDSEEEAKAVLTEGTFKVYFYDGDNWGDPNLYDWDQNANAYDFGDWPGKRMIKGDGSWWYNDVSADVNGFKLNKGSDPNNEAYQIEEKNLKGVDQYIVCKNGMFTIYSSEAEANEAIARNDSFNLHYYAGKDGDGLQDKDKSKWGIVYADIYYYQPSSTNKITIAANVQCTTSGDGWFHLNTWLDATDTAYENGIYVEFKDGYNSANKTAAYQFLNNYRTFVTSQMTMFKSSEAAIASLKNTESSGDTVPDGYTRVWFYHPGGWKNYYVLYSTAAGGQNPDDANLVNYADNFSQMAAQQAYVSENGGNWYYADIPENANYIYFDEDSIFHNGGNISAKYDISGRNTNEIFCVENASIISNGWSTSTADIVKYYNLANAPASNTIRMPITILDYNADNLFFEYDMTFLRNMTLVLGNGGSWYEYDLDNLGQPGNGLCGLGVSDQGKTNPDWPRIDIEGVRPGDAPHVDRNGKEYVTGVLEEDLVNGYPVYTEQAVTYVAKIVEKGYRYYGYNPNQEYNKTQLFEEIYQALLNSSAKPLEGTSDWHAAYEASRQKFSDSSKVAAYDITKDGSLTCMDYAYYVLNNLYNTNSKYNQDYDIYDYLVLQRTSPNVYGFYANYSTNLPTAYNLRQNYGSNGIVYDVENRIIYNDTSKAEEYYNSNDGFGGFFPYNWESMIAAFGEPDEISNDIWQNGSTYGKYYYKRYQAGTAEEKVVEYNGYPTRVDEGNTCLRDYGYTMKLSGKFRYSYDKDLYFTFTGDDDVAMYINGKKVLDLSGAHEAASYTVYISDLVDDGIVQMTDGAYYDLDFFYMERHTTWSNLRIETNIDVIDVAGQVQKHAYEENGNLIPSGSARAEGTKVFYEYELNAGSGDGLENLSFKDESLGIDISAESVSLGSYTDAAGNVIARTTEELTVKVGTTTYTGLNEDGLKKILADGIKAGERILISGIPYVLNKGTEGPVVAGMNGVTEKRPISSSADHVIYVADPAIHVTKTAVSAAGVKLPDNATVQSGETVNYIIVLTNDGNSPIFHAGIADEDLKVEFRVDETGKAVVKLNEYTNASDLTITVKGTGVTDGIYTVSSQTELENLIEKLANVVYPTGGSLEISGVKYPITETFTSVSIGTAEYMTNFGTAEDKGITAYGSAYMNYKKGLSTDKPDWKTYVDPANGAGEEIYTAYIGAYEAMIDRLVTGSLTDEEVTVPAAGQGAGFDVAGTLEDTAVMTLNAKLSSFHYYSQSGQTIQFTLQNETVVDLVDSDPEGTDNWLKTAIAEAGTFELSQGSHMVTVYYKNYTQDNSGGFNVHSVILVDQAGRETELKIDYVNDTGYIKDGTNVQIYDNDAVALNQPGDAITYPVEIPADGTYTVKVQYASAVETKQAAVVFDYMPGDYVLTTVDGADLNPISGTADTKAEYTVNNATVTVDNTGAYPVIQYTCQEGIQEVNTFGVRVTGAAETVKPDTVTITSYDVTDDVYVLDYGLNVDLTDTAYQNGLFQNDKLSVNADREEVSFLGVQAVDSKLDTGAGYQYVYSKDGYGETAEGAYGTVAKDGNGTGASAVYKLNKFLEGIDRYTYAVQAGLKDAAEKNMTTSTPVMEANITIMPATVVYYEDNFSSVITNGTAEGTPDADREQGNGLETQYGYDQAYQNDGTFSNNGYTALSGTDKFAFTFKGTGFDILTRTADADLKVSVYDADQYELKSYTYGEGKVFISVVKKADAWADAKVLKTVTINASYENGTVDQIPLISVDLEKHGSYIVLAQRIGDGGEALKVDGIRIYNPLGTITDEEVADAYDKAEGEKDAKVREIRSMIFGEGYAFDYTNPADPSTAQITEGSGAVAGLVQMTGNQINIATGSTVVECYTGAMTSADIAAEKAENPVNTSSLLGYAVSGPNNELYLTGEAYAFAAVVNDIGDSSMLQIGLKAVEGTAAVQYRAADGEWKEIPDAGSLSASLEMYYRIPVADLWQSNGKTVLMVRAINGTASLTHLKYQDVTFEKITREAFGDVVAGDQNDSSFNIMSSGAAGSKAVLTFSVSDQVKDFTITNKNTGEKVFTYGTAEALPSGITVSRRAADGLTIYVVKMPKTAGTYIITTSTGDSFGTAEFEIEKM